MDQLNLEALAQASKIKEIIADIAKRDISEINDSEPVFGPGGVIVDSLNVLDMLCAVEQEFNIEIPDEDLTENLFESVASFSSHVQKNLL